MTSLLPGKHAESVEFAVRFFEHFEELQYFLVGPDIAVHFGEILSQLVLQLAIVRHLHSKGDYFEHLL